ncbi:MAG TPA: ester cyclase [Desulfovibrio sp.]|uniref:nuclear transport factor 2 family protein n=1 Tax=Desulfovibrio sp. TaxID=885 RepID=UPI002D347753|nr:ester cyclase [Desulfovibrio sp.]HZF61045.1 ester cyclase [Desulfovibrio sp.]
MFRTVLMALLLALTALTGGQAVAQDTRRDLATEEANLKLVVNFYEQFFNKHEVARAAEVVSENYKQHNPEVPDGKKPFVDYFSQFFKETPQSKARIVRTATSGDLVWLQVHSTNSPSDRGQAVLDIFRVKNGKIVEHWDIIQDVPAQSANGNTMF